MTDLAALGLTVQSDGLLKATGTLDKFKAASDKASAGADKLSGQSAKLDGALRKLDATAGGVDTALVQVGNAADVASNRLGGGFAQSMRGVSQQLSQVGQQTMATGNFVQAFAIQLPDLGLAFGAVGAAAGLLAGIALPFVISAITGTKQEAISLDDALDGLIGSLQSYQDFAGRAATSTFELAQEFGIFAGQVQGLSEFMAGVSLDQIFLDLQTTMEPLRGGLTGVTEALADVARAQEQVAEAKIALDAGLIDPTAVLNAQDNLFLFEQAAKDAADAMGVTIPQAQELNAALDVLAAAEGPAQIAQAALNTQKALEEVRNTAGKLPEPLIDTAVAVERLASEAARADTATRQLTASAPGGGWMNAAIQGVNGLIGRLSTALGIKNALVDSNASAGYTGELDRTGQSSGPDSVRTRVQFGGGAFEAPVLGAGLASVDLNAGTGGGGGGGGAARVDEYTEAQKRALSVIADMNEAAVTQADVISALEVMHQSGAIGADQLATAIANVKEQMTDVDKVSFSLSKSIGGVFTDALTSAKSLQDGIKDLLGSMAELFLNAAFQKFLPTLLPGIDFGGFRAAGGPVSNGKSYIVGENGPELFTPGRSGGITPNHAMGGGTGTSVQINNYSGAPVREQRSRGPDGRELIKVIVGEELGTGGYDKQLGRYGATPTKVRR